MNAIRTITVGSNSFPVTASGLLKTPACPNDFPDCPNEVELGNVAFLLFIFCLDEPLVFIFSPRLLL